MVDYRPRSPHVALARRHPAVLVALLSDDLGFVDGQTSAERDHPVQRRLWWRIRRTSRHCLDFPSRRDLGEPGQVPVVERYQRRDGTLEQPIHEPVIEIQTAPIDGAAALGEDARPGNRKAVESQSPGFVSGQDRIPTGDSGRRPSLQSCRQRSSLGAHRMCPRSSDPARRRRLHLQSDRPMWRLPS